MHDISVLLCFASAENKGVTLDSLTLPLNKESPETVDDAPISHTPYINYTKLEFKVKGYSF